jgi:transposase-like protein
MVKISCPVCGSSNVTIEAGDHDRIIRWFFICLDCLYEKEITKQEMKKMVEES